MKIIFVFILLLLGEIQAQYEEYKCDIYVGSSICLEGGMNFLIILSFGGQIEIAKKYLDPSTIGYWNFDNEKFIDHSDSKHLTKRINIERTSSAQGFKTAGLFNKESELNIYLVPPWPFDQATVGFLLYFEELMKINQQQNNQTVPVSYCGILSFFDIFTPDNSEYTQLSINLNVYTRQIVIILIKNQDKKNEETILIQSTMKVQPQMWYRIHLIQSDLLKLYVNGYLCGVSKVKFSALWKNIIVGYKLNIDNSKCPLNFLFDSFRLNDKALEKSFIEAASQQFGGYSDQVMLSCENCYQSKAMNCFTGFHLCSSLELYSFAINVARDMGWVSNTNANFWSADTDINRVTVTQTGIGLCCRNVNYV